MSKIVANQLSATMLNFENKNIQLFVLVTIALHCTASDLGNILEDCDSMPETPCIALWPTGKVPNEKEGGFKGNETRSPDDGHGCGMHRNEACDHIRDVSVPTLTPFLAKNGRYSPLLA